MLLILQLHLLPKQLILPAPAAEAAHPAAAAPAVAEAAHAAKAPFGPPDGAPLIEDYNEAEHGREIGAPI